MWKNILWIPICLIILFLFVPEEMVLFVQGLVLLGFIILIFIGWYWVQSFRYRALILKGEAHASQLKGRVIQTPRGSWIETGPKLEIVPLDDNPFLRINGHDRPLTPDERWYRSLTKPIKGEFQPLPPIERVLENTESVFDLIDQHPHLLLIGGTGNGKTVLLRILAEHKRQQGYKIIVLDSRSHPDHWDSFDRYETEEKIDRMIIRLHQVLRTNIEALRQGQATEADFDNHKVVVITDEWGRIVEECEGAKKFIEIMAKESRKYGIYLIFSTQTNQASELGLDQRYKTMNCFLQLEIQNRQDGRFVKAKKGSQFLGEYEVPFVNVPKQLPTGYIPPTLEILTDLEKKIRDVYLQTHSLRAVAREVLGIEDKKINSDNTNEIKAILKKIGVYTSVQRDLENS